MFHVLIFNYTKSHAPPPPPRPPPPTPNKKKQKKKKKKKKKTTDINQLTNPFKLVLYLNRIKKVMPAQYLRKMTHPCLETTDQSLS